MPRGRICITIFWDRSCPSFLLRLAWGLIMDQNITSMFFGGNGGIYDATITSPAFKKERSKFANASKSNYSIMLNRTELLDLS